VIDMATITKQIMIEAEVTFEVETDSHYGADADGNRGISMTWVDVDKISDLKINGISIKDKKTQDKFSEFVEDSTEYFEFEECVDNRTEKELKEAYGV